MPINILKLASIKQFYTWNWTPTSTIVKGSCRRIDLSPPLKDVRSYYECPLLQPLLVVRRLSYFVLLRDNDDKTRALPLAKHDPSVCPLSSELVVYNFVTCTRSWRGRGWGGGCWSCEVVVGLTAIDGRVSHAGYFYPWVWLRAIGKELCNLKKDSTSSFTNISVVWTLSFAIKLFLNRFKCSFDKHIFSPSWRILLIVYH